MLVYYLFSYDWDNATSFIGHICIYRHIVVPFMYYIIHINIQFRPSFKTFFYNFLHKRLSRCSPFHAQPPPPTNLVDQKQLSVTSQTPSEEGPPLPGRAKQGSISGRPSLKGCLTCGTLSIFGQHTKQKKKCMCGDVYIKNMVKSHLPLTEEIHTPET